MTRVRRRSRDRMRQISSGEDTSQEPEVSQIVGGLGGVQTSGDRDDEEQTPDSTPLDTVT